MLIIRWIRRHRICKIFLLLLFVILTANVYYFIHHSMCSVESSKKLLEDLCNLYRKREVLGNLCQAICENSLIRFDTCTNYKHGKKVLFVECDACEPPASVKAVLKTKSDLLNRDKLDISKPNDILSTQTFLNLSNRIMRDSVLSEFGIDTSFIEDVLSELWFGRIEDYIKESGLPYPDASWVAVQSIWSLFRQDEYAFMKLHQAYTFVPKIYGTCGPIYITEYTPSGSELETSFLHRPGSSWNQRASIAISILNLIKTFNTGLHQPLEICDVKGDNFGIGDYGRVVLLDADTVFFRDKFEKDILNDQCRKHTDCDFFDCRGLCNTTTGKCFQRRVNNNLQSVCQDVFLGILPHFFAGLLHSPPSDFKLELIEILEKCAYPSNNKADIVRVPATDETFRKLHTLLSKSIR
ncbi:hypothetical protein ACJMK2_010225 [Sinanodonta woodiana]|uniref:FAM69 N-terminal domain-containing protein n=1 Tax=Sinanodonta woodiana TaxID=1069815 RepID=A0ABD3VHN4_SINWO